MTKPKRSPINFDKTIMGVNVTERGPQSYSKQLKLGFLGFNLNLSKRGLTGSVSLPGTGLSKRNIRLIDF
mgnify:CR=1 FL=1